MIIQEPIKATISFALDNYAYSDAIFLSERLHAEVSTDESLYLLATAYYRSGKPNVSYSLLSTKHLKLCKSPQCLFLMAKCCFELHKYTEALDTITTAFTNDDILLKQDQKYNRKDFIQFYGEIASFVAQLLGSIYVKLDHIDLATHYYTISLKINPFLWSSYEKLVQLEPSLVDCNKLITLDNFEFKYSCGTNPLINLLNSNGTHIAPPLAKLSDNTNTSHTQTTPQQQTSVCPRSKIEISTPYAVLKQSHETNKLDVITPEINGSWNMMTCLAPSKNTPNKASRKLTSNVALKLLTNDASVNNANSNSSLPTVNNLVSRSLLNSMESSILPRHAFGVLQLDEESLNMDEFPEKDNTNINTRSNISSQRNANNDVTPAPVKKPHTRRNSQQDIQDSNSQLINDMSTATGVLPRRSTRLYSGSRSVKENASSPKASKITRTPTKRSRRTISFEKSADQKEIKEVGIENSLLNNANNKVTCIDLTKAGIKVQRSSAFGLIELMAKFASAYKLLSEFKCKEAIEEFKNLSSTHLNTGFVLSSIGRAYFEMGKYDDAIHYFKKCHHLEPYRLQGMEIYSTALWHQQKEVELSCLSQELIEFDKHSPETWCVAGNCFSLQKEHEVSIKFLKRAIQVDPDFSYAYTLLGHELVSADELDNAMSCFRNATRIDRRHYNAWYGIGMIFYKQEKYPYAYYNYKRALEISPYNPILMCHLAIVCHHMKNSKKAINLLDDASKLDPNNALVKFHRASIYFSSERYSLALEELDQLKQIVPKESMVYFLIGKIHKIRGETHLALMNFSWAMDLDPKGANNQIKELIDRQYGNEDEMLIHSNNPDSSITSNASPSTPNTTPFQQRSTLTPNAPSANSSTLNLSTGNNINGSNNSNNISNNSNNSFTLNNNNRMTPRPQLNVIHRYILTDDNDIQMMNDEIGDEEEEEEEVDEDPNLPIIDYR